MRNLKDGSVVVSGVVGLHSLNVKDTTFKTDGDYSVNLLLQKKTPEMEAFISHVKTVLEKEGMSIKDEMEKQKSPLSKRYDGDTIYNSYNGALNEHGEPKGAHLQGTYGFKIRTTRDYTCVNKNNVEIDKTKVNFNGAEVEVWFSPYIYNNKFGKGLTFLLKGIKVIEEGKFGLCSVEDAFGAAIADDGLSDCPF